MSEEYIQKVFYYVKEVLIQNITIIDKIIEHKLEFSHIKDHHNYHTIYQQLCTIENFLLFFLYSTPISNQRSFKAKVESCLTCVYENKIRYSRIF